ncbi:MAG: response regulator transcription factor [Tepidisphaeraceae bacterium]
MSKDVPARTILVIEDEPALSAVVARFLKQVGYHTVVKHTGASALEYVKTHTPDAVITDVHLPDFNGLVLTQKFRLQFGDTMPIIVLSGDTSMEVLKTLPHVGATYFFNKPFNPEVLLERLAACFENRPAAQDC